MVSQENGSTPVTVSGLYPVDQFLVAGSVSGTFTCAQVASLTPAGSPNRIRFTVGTAEPAVGAGHFLVLQTNIEGLRLADLKFGTAAARVLTIQFGVKAPAGTYSISLYNAAANRTYAGEYTIAAGEANTDVVKSVTLTADTTGTWPTSNTLSLSINWSLMCAPNVAGVAGAWQAGAVLGSTNQFNLFGTSGNVFELFDVGVYEGSVAPAFQVPDFASELVKCRRYWTQTYAACDYAVTVANQASVVAVTFGIPMRAAPTLTGVVGAVGSGTTGCSMGLGDAQTYGCYLQLIATVAPPNRAYWYGSVKANARL